MEALIKYDGTVEQIKAAKAEDKVIESREELEKIVEEKIKEIKSAEELEEERKRAIKLIPW